MGINQNVRHAPPKAAAMLEALRGLGYNIETALADIIDNSVSAGARNIELSFVWSGTNSRISILDDGCGMSDAELEKAMRLGERNPLDDRSSNDLGRFGLGLKTASFSQCKRLTVASIADGAFHCLRWDLEYLEQSQDDGWYLFEGPATGSDQWLDSLRTREHGTLVLWEIPDRIVTSGYTEQNFLDVIDRIEKHLSMVFHRFLEGKASLHIYINGRELQPWDPFLCGHPAKPWHSPIASAPMAPEIQIECHVLPHKDHLTEQEFITAQGPGGWIAQQGFYVYRNHRLLVAGSWLGLGRSWIKDEAHKLARIRLDIPNNTDSEWKIDIRKSVARPPVYVRAWLTMFAEASRARARKAFAHRGRAVKEINSGEVARAWAVERFPSGGLRYRIDSAHAAVRNVLDNAGHLTPQILTMLRIIEETVPVQRIWIDTAENNEIPRTGLDSAPTDEVRELLSVMYSSFLRQGMNSERARERLMRTEPFNNFPQLILEMKEPS